MKQQEIFTISSIEQMHQALGLDAPMHPLVSVIRMKDFPPNQYEGGIKVRTDLYFITLKDGMEGSMSYGRSSYDFTNGTLLFMAPGQVMESHDYEVPADSNGWMIAFHPDLIRRFPLGKHIHDYSFFSYEVNEALHLSDHEKKSLTDLIDQIDLELNNRIDRFSQKLICSNIELLLDYCTRYYDRQFYTRSDINQGLLSKFESQLKTYFETGKATLKGLPSVVSVAEAMNLSANYLSDMLKRETGKTAQEHIHFQIIEQAKTLLLNSQEPVSQIAYTLGFEYPQHFSKLFKNKVGMTPSAFRTTA